MPWSQWMSTAEHLAGIDNRVHRFTRNRQASPHGRKRALQLVYSTPSTWTSTQTSTSKSTCCHSLSLHGIIVFLALAVCMPPSIFIGSLAMAAACPPPPPPPPSDGFGGGGPGGGGWKGPPGGGHKGEGLHWSKKQQYRHKKRFRSNESIWY